VIKNGQSRDTGNIGYTRHRTKTNKTKNTTQKTKKDDPQKTGGEPRTIAHSRFDTKIYPY